MSNALENVIKLQEFPTIPAALFGNIDVTGVDDATDIILDALAEAESQGCGNIALPRRGIIKLSDLIPLSSLIGLSGGYWNYDVFSSAEPTGTVLKWAGAAGGTMISLSTPDMAAQEKIGGAFLRGLALDGDELADYGVVMSSAEACDLSRILFKHARKFGLSLRVNANLPADSRAGDTQQCDFRNLLFRCDGDDGLGGLTQGGIELRGDDSRTATGNSSSNTFTNVMARIANGTAVDLVNADTNSFFKTRVFMPSALGYTGKALLFRAEPSATPVGSPHYARTNQFFHFHSAFATVEAEGTATGTPSRDNAIYGYNLDGNAPNNIPVIGVGARLTVDSPRTTTHAHWNLLAHTGTDAADAHSVAATARDVLEAQPSLVAPLMAYSGSGRNLTLIRPGAPVLFWDVDINSAGNLIVTRGSGNGCMSVAALGLATLVTTGSPTLTNQNSILLVDASGGSKTITLALANTFGTARSAPLEIRRIDNSTNSVTVQRQGSDTLNGVTSETLLPGQVNRYIADGVSAWYSDGPTAVVSLGTKTWATLPAASAVNGAFAIVSDVANGSMWRSNGTMWLPISRQLPIFQSGAGYILQGLAASSTVAQTGTVVTVTNGASVAHNIPATTFDGFNVFFPGSASIPSGWYAGFSRTGAATYDFTRGSATVASESVNGGAAYTTETTVVTMTLPGGMMGANGALQFHAYHDWNNSGGTKTPRVKFGGTTIFSTAGTTNMSGRAIGPFIMNTNSVGAQLSAISNGGGSVSGTMAGGSNNVRTSINTANDVTMLYTLQCTTASDFVTLGPYVVTVTPAS